MQYRTVMGDRKLNMRREKGCDRAIARLCITVLCRHLVDKEGLMYLSEDVGIVEGEITESVHILFYLCANWCFFWRGISIWSPAEVGQEKTESLFRKKSTRSAFSLAETGRTVYAQFVLIIHSLIFCTRLFLLRTTRHSRRVIRSAAPANEEYLFIFR